MLNLLLRLIFALNQQSQQKCSIALTPNDNKDVLDILKDQDFPIILTNNKTDLLLYSFKEGFGYLLRYRNIMYNSPLFMRSTNCIIGLQSGAIFNEALFFETATMKFNILINNQSMPEQLRFPMLQLIIGKFIRIACPILRGTQFYPNLLRPQDFLNLSPLDYCKKLNFWKNKTLKVLISLQYTTFLELFMLALVASSVDCELELKFVYDQNYGMPLQEMLKRFDVQSSSIQVFKRIDFELKFTTLHSSFLRYDFVDDSEIVSVGMAARGFVISHYGNIIHSLLQLVEDPLLQHFVYT